MSSRIRFVVYVDPQPKLRPRFNMMSRRVYTPEKVHSFQNEVRQQVVLAYGDSVEYPIFSVDVPLSVDLDFISKLPKVHPGSKISHSLGLHWRGNGDDIDNLAKSVMDGLNGVLWEDDRQIVEMRMRKLFASRKRRPNDSLDVFVDSDDRPRVCIAVRPVGAAPVETCESSNDSAEDYWRNQ